MIAFFHNGKGVPPSGLMSPSEIFALSKTWSENNRYCLPPRKEIPGRKLVCHEIMLQKYLMFVWENSAHLNGGGGGGGDLSRFWAEPKSRPIIWGKFFIEKHQKLMKMTRIY